MAIGLAVVPVLEPVVEEALAHLLMAKLKSARIRTRTQLLMEERRVLLRWGYSAIVKAKE